MQVTFKINHALTKPGEKAYIVGKSQKLGNWIVSHLLSNFRHPFSQHNTWHRFCFHTLMAT